MFLKALTLAGSLFLISPSSEAETQKFYFDVSLLSGIWSESYSTSEVCSPTNRLMRMQFSNDRREFAILYDKKNMTSLGEMDRINASVISSTTSSVVIRYENESRLKISGKPMEWELSVVAPGVYRWRETDWPQDKVNVVVGIRCSQ